MIASLKGKLIRKSPTDLVMETGGVGFHLNISLASYEAIGEPGDEVMLHTH